MLVLFAVFMALAEVLKKELKQYCKWYVFSHAQKVFL